jgi:hypothetical protein
MSQILTGGCLCGAVRYRYEGEVRAANICHCADCRRVSGSAFGVSVPVDAAGFEIVSGAPKGFTKDGDSGRPVARFFCPECGSPLFTVPPLHPEVRFLKAGSLDDPTVVKPVRQSWLQSRVEWAVIDPELPGFEKGRV